MSALANGRNRGNDGLNVGGVPRVDLLPPEVRAAGEAAVLRKRLGLGLIGVVAVVVVAVGASSVYALGSGARLIAAQNETSTLMSEQGQYVEVRQVQQALSAAIDAEQVGSWTEVQWRDYMKAVQATLPAGVAVTLTSVAAATPFEEFAQSAAPLANARVATLTFTASSATLPDVPAWLTGLATLPGYAGATPNSTTLNTETNSYDVAMTLQLGAGALSGRFVPVEAPEATAEDAAADTAEQGGN